MTLKTTRPSPGGLPAEAYVGRPHPRSGLFYAACAREWDTDICGCPLCQRQAVDPDELGQHLPRPGEPEAG
jgi:hypothetical protein